MRTATAVPEVVTPLFIPIKAASLRFGVTVFAMRVLVWSKLLKPVKHGRQYLFADADLVELAAKLRSGEVSFPRSPKYAGQRKAKARKNEPRIIPASRSAKVSA
jgi:hypothetical protein